MNSDFQTDVFISRFAELKKESGETNKDLQDVFGLSLSALINYQTGKRIPDIAFLHKLSQHFGVSADYLLGLSDVKSTEQDMKTACAVTGLSEDALERIHEFTKPELRNFFNAIVCTEEFTDILNCFLDYLQTYEPDKILQNASRNIDNDMSREKVIELLQYWTENGESLRKLGLYVVDEKMQREFILHDISNLVASMLDCYENETEKIKHEAKEEKKTGFKITNLSELPNFSHYFLPPMANDEAVSYKISKIKDSNQEVTDHAQHHETQE